jgi:hypothetical protein
MPCTKRKIYYSYSERIRMKGMDWNDLAQDRDKSQVLMNMAVTVRLHKYGQFLDYQRKYSISFSRLCSWECLENGES